MFLGTDERRGTDASERKDSGLDTIILARPAQGRHRLVAARPARSAFGAVAAPLIGLGGAQDALPLGLVAVVSMGAAVLAHLLAVHVRAPRPRPTTAIHAMAKVV